MSYSSYSFSSILFILNIYIFFTETKTEQREKIVFVLLPLCQTSIWKKSRMFFILTGVAVGHTTFKHFNGMRPHGRLRLQNKQKPL